MHTLKNAKPKETNMTLTLKQGGQMRIVNGMRILNFTGGGAQGQLKKVF
jgi:hypothetical protein